LDVQNRSRVPVRGSWFWFSVQSSEFRVRSSGFPVSPFPGSGFRVPGSGVPVELQFLKSWQPCLTAEPACIRMCTSAGLED
jgi:hypothetical protein